MVGDNAPRDGGVENGARLLRFATAVLGDDLEGLAAARDDIVAVMADFRSAIGSNDFATASEKGRSV